MTGASGGIGAETCRWLAANGVDVAVGGRNQATLERVSAEVVAFGVRATPVVADCTDADSLEAARARIERTLGAVDLVVAFAGGATAAPTPVDAMSEDDWRTAIDDNLTATFLTLKTFLPGMKSRNSGAIVTMASSAGRVASPAAPGCAAAKAGVIMLTRHLAQEVGALGVRVNCLVPSSILTERTARRISSDLRPRIAALHPINRLGTPADVAVAALFLLSDSASWITGATLDVAGGRHMH